MRWLAPVILACGCSGKPAGSASAGAGGGTSAGRCDAVRGKIEQLYRTEARAREPGRIDEAVADNTAMVMTDCAKAPARVTPCIAAATTAAELEARCLAPIDDEGTEGDRVGR
jgi:hypothetical protein